MIPSVLSRLVILLFGTLYPAYSSYKAVRTKNVKEYVKWMMYWIVFALFTCAETFTDIFLSFWFPFYYEFKIILVVYLLSPATNGSSVLYRKFVHPVLTRKEQEIDECIAKTMEQGYHTMLNLGSRSVAYATSVIMQTAIKGGGGLVNHIRKSYSLDDINTREGRHRKKDSKDETDNDQDEERHKYRRRRTYSPRRTVSSGSQVDLYFPEMDEYKRSPVPLEQNFVSHIRSSEDISSGYSSTEPLYSGAKYGSKDQLLRTTSMGPTTRNRTRLAKKQSEDESGCSTAEPNGSQYETDIPSPIHHDLTDFLAPFVKPEYRYLFASLTQQQICSFLNTATCLPEPVAEPVPKPVVEPVAEPVHKPVAEPVSMPEPELTKTTPSAVLQSILRDKSAEKESISVDKAQIEKIDSEVAADKAEGDKNDQETRSGKYNKRPAPIPPSCSDTVDDEGEFSTPGTSPVLGRKFGEEEEFDSPAEVKTEESPPENKPEKKTKHKGKGKTGESQISKMLHLSKLQFPFWNQKNERHSPAISESSSVSEMSRNSSHVSLASKGDQESFISLKGDEAGEGEVNVREMSQSPSSKRRSFVE